MLSLWKLRVGGEAYYLGQVARGIDDYYSGEREAPGRWMGIGSSVLDMFGDVDGEDLRAVLAGLVPGTGLSPNGTQIRPWKSRVPGFDLTFSAPKSVSVIYAFADPLVRAQITEAIDQAVDRCGLVAGTRGVFRAALVEQPASQDGPVRAVGYPSAARGRVHCGRVPSPHQSRG